MEELSSVRNFVRPSTRNVVDGDTVEYILPWALLLAVLDIALGRGLLVGTQPSIFTH